MRVYLDSCIIIYLTESSADVRDRISPRLLSSAGAVPTVVFTDLSRLEPFLVEREGVPNLALQSGRESRQFPVTNLV